MALRLKTHTVLVCLLRTVMVEQLLLMLMLSAMQTLVV
jgi:hypothetical protein